MLLFTITFGGLLLMMGHHSRGESLFYYFRLEDQVPENHLLRLIDRHVNLEFIRAQLKDAYSDAGRPSIDPELLVRMLLVGYLYGVASERKLVEELRMHLAWRWFTGLGFDQEIPHHSTFSKNRHGRFQESNLFQEIFEEIVASCVIVGVQATPARLSQESAAARDMIERYRERYGYLPQTLAADTTYGNGELLQWLDERGITPYIRVKEGPNSPPDLYGIEKFTYVPEENCYLCPAGKPLHYVGINKRNRAHRYYSTVKRCRGCGQKPQCTRGEFRTPAIHPR